MRLKVPGETTGYIGPVEFKDGVSIGLVSPRIANQFRAIMSGVVIMQDDGETVDEALNCLSNILPLGYYVDTGLESPSPFLTDWEGKYPEVRSEPIPDKDQAQGEAVEQETVSAGAWTRAELEAVADKDGIAGLRDIASPAGITRRSINELIDAILSASVAK